MERPIVIPGEPATAPADPNAGHDLRALSVRWFHDVWNHGRVSTVDELVSSEARVHGLDAPGAPAAAGAPHDAREQFFRFYNAMRAGFPDLQVTVEDLLRDGDRTAVRLTCRATHAGPAFGLAATGRAVTFTAMVLMRWRDGKIVEAWNEVDGAGLVRQIS